MPHVSPTITSNLHASTLCWTSMIVFTITQIMRSSNINSDRLSFFRIQSLLFSFYFPSSLILSPLFFTDHTVTSSILLLLLQLPPGSSSFLLLLFLPPFIASTRSQSRSEMTVAAASTTVAVASVPTRRQRRLARDTLLQWWWRWWADQGLRRQVSRVRFWDGGGLGLVLYHVDFKIFVCSPRNPPFIYSSKIKSDSNTISLLDSNTNLPTHFYGTVH